jgi:hypothetical protein
LLIKSKAVFQGKSREFAIYKAPVLGEQKSRHSYTNSCTFLNKRGLRRPHAEFPAGMIASRHRRIGLVGQAQMSVVDQGRDLQCVVGTLPGRMIMSEAPEFFINWRD